MASDSIEQPEEFEESGNQEARNGDTKEDWKLGFSLFSWSPGFQIHSSVDLPEERRPWGGVGGKAKNPKKKY